MDCNRCGADLSAPDSSNSQDSTLEGLLKTLAEVANGPGICQLGEIDRIVGTAVTASQGYHDNLGDRVKTAMEAVHDHIQQNYEED